MAIEHSEEGRQSPASQRLREFLRARQQAWQEGIPEFEQFERELHEQVMALEREWVAEELARYDVQAERIEVGGESYHGKRASSVGKTKELRQVGDGPSGLFALDFHGVFAGIPP